MQKSQLKNISYKKNENFKKLLYPEFSLKYFNLHLSVGTQLTQLKESNGKKTNQTKTKNAIPSANRHDRVNEWDILISQFYLTSPLWIQITNITKKWHHCNSTNFLAICMGHVLPLIQWDFWNWIQLNSNHRISRLKQNKKKTLTRNNHE